MSTYSEQVGNKLNGLLERTYDAEKGFHNAAENTNNASLKQYFTKKAEQRKSFGHDLKNEIRSFGQEVDKGGSVEGTLHRTWMDLKSTFSSNDEEAMLEEAITGEKKAIDDYKEAINENDIPSSTKNLLEQQVSKIESGLATVKTLEDVY